MKIAILGYGKEGKCAEKWLKRQQPEAEIVIFDKFAIEDLGNFGLNEFDLIVRTPSVSPQKIAEVAPDVEITSITKLFFESCPCQIVGITGTKGKGTTASMIRDLLEKLGKKVWLVGNIGVPALEVLDDIEEPDIVIYELSSFQLWDLEMSPHVAVVLRVEPDHLNIHDGYKDYVAAKANIAKWQKSSDYCIYYGQNSDSRAIAETGNAQKIAYPAGDEDIKFLVENLRIVGEHNKENAEAAVLATAVAIGSSVDDFIKSYRNELIEALKNFKGLPHRLEYICEKNGVKYYDDSFSSAYPAMNVAIDAFSNQPTIIIAGGLDRGLDLTTAKQKLFHSENIKKVILIGQTKEKLATNENSEEFILANNLKDAIHQAKNEAEHFQNSVVLLSPGAASFDMFRNFEERGQEFQKIVRNL